MFNFKLKFNFFFQILYGPIKLGSLTTLSLKENVGINGQKISHILKSLAFDKSFESYFS